MEVIKTYMVKSQVCGFDKVYKCKRANATVWVLEYQVSKQVLGAETKIIEEKEALTLISK